MRGLLIGYNRAVVAARSAEYIRQGNMQRLCLIQAIEAWEQAFGRTAMLPIEEVQIENQCGYIFRGSTNQIKYIEDYEHQQSDCA